MRRMHNSKQQEREKSLSLIYNEAISPYFLCVAHGILWDQSMLEKGEKSLKPEIARFIRCNIEKKGEPVKTSNFKAIFLACFLATSFFIF